MRPLRLLLVAVLLATGAACTGAARSIGRGTAEGFVEGTFEGLDQEDLQGRITAGLRDHEVRLAVAELAAAASAGALQGVDAEVQREQLVGLARDVARAFSQEIRGNLEGIELVPDLDPMLERAVNRMLDAALSGQRQEQIEQAVLRVLESSLVEIAASLREHLGPAMGDVVEQELVPAVRGLFGDLFSEQISPAVLDLMLDPRFQRAMGENSRAISRGFLLGSNDALAILDEAAERRGNKSFLDLVTDYRATTESIGTFLAITQTVALVALAVALVRTLRRMQDLSDRVAAAEPALLELLHARAMQRREAGWGEPPTMVGPEEPEPPDEHPPGG